MNEIEFFSLKRGAYVIMPISECYKLQTRRKAKHNYTVNAIDPYGLRLTKQITKKDFENLSCRSVEYSTSTISSKL
jgi:hypothetical protein